VQENEGHGAFALPSFVYEMDAQAIDLGAEMGELVKCPLLCPPIKSISPVFEQLLHIGQIGAVVPASTRDLIGPAGIGEA
jgi:hypothetical protein